MTIFHSKDYKFSVKNYLPQSAFLQTSVVIIEVQYIFVINYLQKAKHKKAPRNIYYL